MTQTPPYQVTDPATGEVAETFPFATDAEVAEALAAATEAFAAWRLRPVAERAAVVKRIAGLFTERAADLAALITKEMGKRPAQAVGEAQFCTDIFNYYADNGPGLIADKPLPGHDTARVEYRPVGPVLGVTPWNYPCYRAVANRATSLGNGPRAALRITASAAPSAKVHYRQTTPSLAVLRYPPGAVVPGVAGVKTAPGSAGASAPAGVTGARQAKAADLPVPWSCQDLDAGQAVGLRKVKAVVAPQPWMTAEYLPAEVNDTVPVSERRLSSSALR